MNIRGVLRRYAEAIADDHVALLLSAGIDSASILFALQDAGKKVTCYSFMLDKRMSTDFEYARKNARRFGAEFRAVLLPDDIPTLKKDLKELAYLGARSKTDFECFWPMLHAYRAVEQRVVYSGMGADGHFCISKKGMIHYRDKIDEFRRMTFSKRGYSQQELHKEFAASLGKAAILPYLSQEMQDAVRGTTWVQANKPKQKQLILDAYPKRFEKMRVMPHTNLQLGDSGISDHFRKLLYTDWNTDRWRSPIGIYNALVAGRLR
ncbi:MAG: asparagine synthase-related protein [Pirellulales bacterium]